MGEVITCRPDRSSKNQILRELPTDRWQWAARKTKSRAKLVRSGLFSVGIVFAFWYRPPTGGAGLVAKLKLEGTTNPAKVPVADRSQVSALC